MIQSLLIQLYSLPNTVFTIDEISQLNPEITSDQILSKLHYATKTGKFIRPRQGLYAKPDYNQLELANKLYKPSYISLETVLSQSSVIFQHYTTTFAISYLTRLVTISDNNIQYRQAAPHILTNTQGVENKDGYYIATLERAFLDAIYVYKDYHFDNLNPINWNLAAKLKSIYKSKILDQRFETYFKIAKEY